MPNDDQSLKPTCIPPTSSETLKGIAHHYVISLLLPSMSSGGLRKGGSKAHPKIWLPRPLSVTWKSCSNSRPSQTSGDQWETDTWVCNCAWLLLLHATAAYKSFDGLVQLCTQKYITSRQMAVHFTPLTPLKSATGCTTTRVMIYHCGRALASSTLTY